MSPLVALKIEGRLAGAILTVLSRLSVRTEKEVVKILAVVWRSRYFLKVAARALRFWHTK